MHQCIKKLKIFSEGNSVYLHVPHASFLQTGITKFGQDYTGLLVIDTVLDSTHYKFRDLENRVKLDTFTSKDLELTC